MNLLNQRNKKKIWTLASKKELEKYWNHLGNSWTESSMRQQSHKAIYIFPNFSMFCKNFKKLWNVSLWLNIDALTDGNIEYCVSMFSDQGSHMGLCRLRNVLVLLQETPLTASSMRNPIPEQLTLEWNSRNNDSVRKIQTWRKEEKITNLICFHTSNFNSFKVFWGRRAVVKHGLFNTNIDFENWSPIHGPRPTLPFNF